MKMLTRMIKAQIVGLLRRPDKLGLLAMTGCLVAILFCTPLYATNSMNIKRDDVINLAIDQLKTPPSVELKPIRVNLGEVHARKQYLLARALYLYQQRRLSAAKGDLKEILFADPKNESASHYLAETNAIVAARKKPQAVLMEEQKGIISVQKAKTGGIHGKEYFGDTDGRQRLTTNTMVASHKANQQGLDLTNVGISEGMKLEGTLGDFTYTATANVDYYNRDDIRENVRFRTATWWMKNDKIQFILGDTSSYFSRYVLNGVSYRGVNLNMDLYKNAFGDVTDNITLLYGKIPYFFLDEDKYIYPRDIVGVRNKLSLWGIWDLNASLAYLWDSDAKVKKINSTNKGKENAVISVDQAFKLIPNIWTVYGENAFSYANDDLKTDTKILRSTAHYFASDFKIDKFKAYSSYEWIDPNFRSFVGLSGFTANKQVTVDREHITNFITYEPYEEVYFSLQHSRTRTNLDKRQETETIKTNNYKAYLKIMPKNNLPRFTVRGSLWTGDSNPGPFDSPWMQDSWDAVFEMAKTFGDTDLSTSYGIRRYSEYINETSTYGDALGHEFSLAARKRIFDRIEVAPSYTLSRVALEKKPNRPLYTETITGHLFDINISSWLWDTAHLTLDYSFSTAESFTTPSVWGSNNALTTTFSWPFTRDLGNGKKLVFSPFVSYHCADGTSTLLERNYLATRLEGDYFLTENSKLNLTGEYRDNAASDPSYVGFGDEYRVMLSYKSVYGF